MFVGIVLVTALLLAQAPGNSPDYSAEGLKALDANQPAAAEPLFRKAVEADGADFGAHFNLALALSLQHKDTEAIAELRRTLELKPGLYEANLNLGILLVRTKQPADALAALGEAAEARPKEPRPRLYSAEALMQTGDAAAAEKEFSAVLELDPKNANAQAGLAGALLRENKLPEAANAFRAAGNKDGLLEVAAAFERDGRKAEAIDIYKEFPENPAVRRRLGQLQIDDKDAAAAVTNLEAAVRARPSTANRLALADAYKLAKEPVKMTEQLQLAAAADPDNFDVHMDYGRALRDAHRLMAAAGQFQAAARLKPDSVAAWNELASALIVAENYPEGLAALDHIRALGKETPGNYFFRAITLDKLKMKPQALAAYRQFLTGDDGAHPDQDFQARQRARIIENELKKK